MRAGIELGGTNIYICIGEIIDNKPMIKYKNRIDTLDPEQTVTQIVQWLQQYQFESIHLATFGPVCLHKELDNYGSITNTPKLKWQNYPIAKELSQRLQKPFYIDTDVNACAMAEYTLGNHKIKNSLAYVTVGTGVGVGLIVNGKCVHGMLHPEGGHMRIQKLEKESEFPGVCAFHGDCLEGLCTNVAIAKRLNCSIHDLHTITDDHPIWDMVAYYLATLCFNLILLLSIEKIVIGGGVLNRKILYKLINKHLNQLSNGYVLIPENYIVPPAIEDVGLIGALLLS